MGNSEQAQGQVRPWRIADTLEIVIRDIRPGDRNYIIDSWHKSAHVGMSWVPTHIYLPEMQARITRLLHRSKVVVACDPEDPDFIIGWACTENGTLHYVFVRHAFQLAGVCTRLLAGLPLPLVVTHCTPDWERVWTKPYKYTPSKLA